ncbi:hypothetical protein [Streptomyces sp. NPDC059786]|uniref:hypothetical protein n=1 Tax=Streptomyces sp. NPDC059786 TaxID=3346946 RepID=UPI0036577C28
MSAPPEPKAAPEYTAKTLVIGLVIILLAGCAVVAYFNKGLYLLPDKVCDGAVSRDVVIRILPRTRTAGYEAEQHNEGEDFHFGCRVDTSAGPLISGRADIADVSLKTWHTPDDDSVQVAAGGVEAFAELDSDTSNTYVPCVPRGAEAGDARESYALTVEVGVIGKGRGSPAALRQAVTDFAYQFTVHAYDLAGCQGTRKFPDELPRYEAAG